MSAPEKITARRENRRTRLAAIAEAAISSIFEPAVLEAQMRQEREDIAGLQRALPRGGDHA